MAQYKRYHTNREVIQAYVQEKSKNGTNPGKSIYFEGDIIYSYGSHFPMAVRLEEEDFYICNGDRYSKTTSKHQFLLFREIPNYKRVEIPFSALNRALNANAQKYVEWPGQVKHVRVRAFAEDRWIDTGRYDKDGNMIREHVLGGVLFEYNGRVFLSSIDSSGSGRRGLYFITELRDVSVGTLDEAFESLKPDEIKWAEREGFDYYRQGEWFFLEVDLPDCVVVHAKKNYYLKHDNPQKVSRHYATMGVDIQGRQFVRGVIRHRRGDHKMLRLYEKGCKEKDKAWFEAYESGLKMQIASYGALGSVD